MEPPSRASIIATIYHAIEEVNDLRETPIRKEADTVLFGQAGQLDSIELVNLIVAIEAQLRAKGFNITLADSKALSAANSPFQNVNTLSDYIMENCKAL